MAQHFAQGLRQYGLSQAKPAAAMPPSGWLEALDLMHAAGVNEVFPVASKPSSRDNVAKSETTHMH